MAATTTVTVPAAAAAAPAPVWPSVMQMFVRVPPHPLRCAILVVACAVAVIPFLLMANTLDCAESLTLPTVEQQNITSCERACEA